MSGNHFHRMTWAMAAGLATTLTTAWAQIPGTDGKCRAPGRAAAPTAGSEDTGRGTTVAGGVGFVAASHLLPRVVEVPTTPDRAAPAAPLPPGSPTSVVVGSTPPTPAPPPAVPGLPPPATKSKDDQKRTHVEAIQATHEVPEERLLDVGIAVFDPGLDEGSRQRLAEQGFSPEMRRAEGRFMAVHLKTTMEGTGHWGAVRVLPGPGEGVDVFVSARILKSNGKRLALEVDAADATGRRWLSRRYEGEADLSAYQPDRVGKYEPFQEVYNRIANDILAARDTLSTPDVVTVRRASALRFGAQLAPEAFASYLKRERTGRFALLRLPAEGDPMVRRVSDIRDRDQMLVDTLNEHYLSFYERMSGAYAGWRQNSYQEQDALDRINRDSKLKKILGGAAMLAGVIMSGKDSQAGRAAGDVAMIGGMLALQAGFQQSKDKVLHEATLKELAASADAEVTPLLVEVEGQQRKLTGSAEKQFTEWRELLHEVFSVETGIPGDPNAAVVVTPPPSD